MGREPAGQPAMAGLQASPPTMPAPSAPKPPPTALAPGFRFHPTDEELVIYYLKRKVGRKAFRFNAIAEVDIYKSEPWDLADKSSLKSRDKEYYFFSALDKKYGNGARMNRATSQGYWKATGNDRPVMHDSRTVGMKKTLVFHSGRAPDGQRTNWVMHEYRLVEEELEKAGLAAGQVVKDAFVLVRVFHKSNIGPPSGQRYAPFIEEEWEDDKTSVIPAVTNGDELAAAHKTTFGKNERDAYVEGKSNRAFIEGNICDMHVEEKSIEQNTKSVDKAPVSALHILGTKVLPGCKIERHDDHPVPCGTNQDERMNDHPSPGAEDQHHLSSGVDRPSSTLLRYKRRRQNDCSTSNGHASENSSVLTQDRCSATTAAAAAATISTMTTATTKPMKTRNFLSALVEYSLLESIEPKETAPAPPAPPPPEDDTDRDVALPPSCVKFIQDLQGEIHRLSMERDNLKFEYVSAQAIINALQAKVEMLTQENEDLKKTFGGD